MFELLYVSDSAGISRRLKRKNYLQERGDQSAAEGKGRRQRRKGKEKKGEKKRGRNGKTKDVWWWDGAEGSREVARGGEETNCRDAPEKAADWERWPQSNVGSSKWRGWEIAPAELAGAQTWATRGWEESKARKKAKWGRRVWGGPFYMFHVFYFQVFVSFLEVFFQDTTLYTFSAVSSMLQEPEPPKKSSASSRSGLRPAFIFFFISSLTCIFVRCVISKSVVICF